VAVGDATANPVLTEQPIGLDAAGDLSGLWRQPAATLLCIVAGVGGLWVLLVEILRWPLPVKLRQCGSGKGAKPKLVSASGTAGRHPLTACKKSKVLVRLTIIFAPSAEPPSAEAVTNRHTHNSRRSAANAVIVSRPSGSSGPLRAAPTGSTLWDAT
jgi:hypothetical protein